MKAFIDQLARGEHLTEAQAEAAMHAMMEGTASPVMIAAYLTLLRTLGETIEELTGSARAMRAHALPVVVDPTGLVDTCGTGGDHSGTFNISTAASFVAASGGVRVAKHGNRAASSLTGSADVLEALGITTSLTPAQAARCLEETGFCFLFAQTYHPAMKHVAPIRRELGYRTMFNVLGPLTNPASPQRQVLGTPSGEIAQKMASVLAALGTEHALVVHAADGLDEISIAAPTRVFEVRGNTVESYAITPETFGVARHTLDDIRGGDAVQNAEMIERILNGQPGAARDVVVINAAAALYVAGRAPTLADGATLAQQLIDDGAARKTLTRIVDFSQSIVKEVGA